MAGLAPAAPGCEGIHRYPDRHAGVVAARIQPGEYYVTTNDEMIVTTLGSCVAACIRDVELGVGGMNHFLLPKASSENDTWASSGGLNAATRYGTHAMETLINSVLKLGARRARLEVKVFGGGQIIRGMSDVGARNIEFVLEFLKTENLTISSRDLGGMSARIVQFFPRSGRVRVKHLERLHDQELVRSEEALRRRVEIAPVQGDIDLF